MIGVILAAGMGTRCNELTKNTSKALFEFNGVPNIENNIDFLKMNGCEKIYIIVGYLSEKFRYLEKKYDSVELIYNEKYNIYNNIYSMYLVIDKLNEDTIIVEGDVVIHKKFLLPTNKNNSIYVVKNREKVSVEWVPTLDEDGYIRKIEVKETEQASYIGIVYFTSEKIKILIDYFKDYFKEDKEIVKKYWDDIYIEKLNDLDMRQYVIPMEWATEVDTYMDFLLARSK